LVEQLLGLLQGSQKKVIVFTVEVKGTASVKKEKKEKKQDGRV